MYLSGGYKYKNTVTQLSERVLEPHVTKRHHARDFVETVVDVKLAFKIHSPK